MQKNTATRAVFFPAARFNRAPLDQVTVVTADAMQPPNGRVKRSVTDSPDTTEWLPAATSTEQEIMQVPPCWSQTLGLVMSANVGF